MTTRSEARPGTWQVPECPWSIEYAPAMLEEIRLAVLDAFFSIPRGGAEIGGILFGSHSDERVRITAFRPMECEHALGPTFLLSEKDLTRLQAQLEGAVADPALRGLEVVGWYHSHTRSDIFLSEADLEIYNRFFPEPWQVALVMRPAGMKPTRAGFFFRDREGVIHSSATYLEFVVGISSEAPPPGNGRHRTPAAPAPVPVAAPRPVPVSPPAETEAQIKPEATNDSPATAEESVPPATLPPAAALMPRGETRPATPAIEPGPSIEMRPAEFVPPAYMLPQEPKRSHLRLWLVLGLLAAAGVTAYLTSGSWLKPPKQAYLHLQALDTQGQLRIQWDRANLSPDVQSGVLEIIDGQSTTAVPLDAAKIRLGSFQYARRSEMVEVHMSVRTAGGKSFEEFTSFIGQPPPNANSHDLESQKRAADLAAEAERARADLKKEELRLLEAQRSIEQMRQAMRKDEERRRVENQMPAESPRRPVQTPANAIQRPTAAPPAASQPPAPATPKPQAPPPTITSQVVKPPSATPEKPPVTAERPVQAPTPPPAPTPKPPPVSQPPQTTAPPVRPQAAPPQPVYAPLSGKWVYSAGSASNSPFPPESVTLNLTEANGQLRGVFSARYRVPKNAKFNGRVTFSFEGPVRQGSSKFPFAASDGMKGNIEIIRLPGRQDAIEVVWRSERDKLTFDDLYFRLP